MKKSSKLIVLLFVFIMIISTNTFASNSNILKTTENIASQNREEEIASLIAEIQKKEYILTKKYSYTNDRTKDLKDAFVEIEIGSGDFVQYQDDEYLIISPQPDEIREDEFGNKYARFNFPILKPKQRVEITIKRKFTSKAFDKPISDDANSQDSKDFEIYLQPQEKIDSDYEKIISKAKELTKRKKSDYQKALAIFEFVNTKMENTKPADYSETGSIFAIENLRGTTEECTTLFVAMCRAVGIPSRVVDGHTIQYITEQVSGELLTSKDVANYVIAEIYLEDYGWIPVDPSVKYVLNGTRLPYYNSFGSINNSTFIAESIYNASESARMYKFVRETNYSIELTEVTESFEKQNEFEDIENYTWAKDDIDFLYSIGVINGYSETEFRPQNNISRIEFVSMLARTLRFLEHETSDFGEIYYYRDYNLNHWSKKDYDYLMRCYQNIANSKTNILAGFDVMANVFGDEWLEMNKPITRAEVVALMDIFLLEKNIESQLNDVSESKFTSSIEKAVKSGIITGYPDMTFRPDNNITRVEIAVILGRFVGKRVI